MERYRCRVCGYIYDPAEGDLLGDIPPETPFSELPPDWECPICGVGSGEFEPIS
jgi:rubredoxin